LSPPSNYANLAFKKNEFNDLDLLDDGAIPSHELGSSLDRSEQIMSPGHLESSSIDISPIRIETSPKKDYYDDLYEGADADVTEINIPKDSFSSPNSPSKSIHTKDSYSSPVSPSKHTKDMYSSPVSQSKNMHTKDTYSPHGSPSKNYLAEDTMGKYDPFDDDEDDHRMIKKSSDYNNSLPIKLKLQNTSPSFSSYDSPTMSRGSPSPRKYEEQSSPRNKREEYNVESIPVMPDFDEHRDNYEDPAPSGKYHNEIDKGFSKGKKGSHDAYNNVREYEEDYIDREPHDKNAPFRLSLEDVKEYRKNREVGYSDAQKAKKKPIDGRPRYLDLYERGTIKGLQALRSASPRPSTGLRDPSPPRIRDASPAPVRIRDRSPAPFRGRSTSRSSSNTKQRDGSRPRYLDLYEKGKNKLLDAPRTKSDNPKARSDPSPARCSTPLRCSTPNRLVQLYEKGRDKLLENPKARSDPSPSRCSTPLRARTPDRVVRLYEMSGKMQDQGRARREQIKNKVDTIHKADMKYRSDSRQRTMKLPPNASSNFSGNAPKLTLY
jgi:hypothetical protein